jgi:hypothetical protein
MYYPQQRFISSMARVYREALLPDEAIGSVTVEEGQQVDIRERVARGLIPGRHRILPAADELGLSNPDDLRELLLVSVNRRFSKGAAIAGENPERGKRIFAPADGLIMRLDRGRIIMQETPAEVNLEAGVRGRVVQVRPGRGAVIEATGAVVQGIWGNGKNLISTIQMEPKRGIANMSRESLETEYRGEIIVTGKTLTRDELEVATIRNFGGIIAPGMDASLLDDVLKAPFAVLLTEGFGRMKMSNAAMSLFQEFDGRQGALDAYLPRRFEPRRPEVIINRPPGEGDRLDSREEAGNPLKTGMRVRISREPYAGVTGKVVDLPRQPVTIGNGLRVRCARVELMAGDYVDVPLTNIEFAGT